MRRSDVLPIAFVVPLQGPTPAFQELVDVLKGKFPPQVALHLPGSEAPPPRR